MNLGYISVGCCSPGLDGVGLPSVEFGSWIKPSDNCPGLKENPDMYPRRPEVLASPNAFTNPFAPALSEVTPAIQFKNLILKIGPPPTLGTNPIPSLTCSP